MPADFAARSVLAATALLALGSLTACEEQITSAPYIAAFNEPEIVRAEDAGAPPNARPGSCWGRHVTPAVVETVSEQVMVQPPEVLADGTVIAPGIFRTETQQRIVQERRELWFETPCVEVWTEEFTASLQRALKVRGLFYGSITAERDARTRAAIRRYQSAEGLDSAILSLESARRLGLVAVPREE
ncbi:MAG: peptidoglycan-binding protein [Shimia sp.]